MKQIIILIAVLILGTTTCNAQFKRGFTRRAANAAKTTPKVLIKYKPHIIVGIGVSTARHQNQKNRHQHTPITGMHPPYRLPKMHHSYRLPKELLTPTAVKKVEPIKARLPRAAVLSRDSVNSYKHILTVSPIDTVYDVLRQDSTVQGTVNKRPWL